MGVKGLRSSRLLAAVLGLLLLSGCTISVDLGVDDQTEESDLDMAALEVLFQDYLDAISGDGDLDALAAITVYPNPDDLGFISGAELPLECLETERASWDNLGVTADSEVDIQVGSLAVIGYIELSAGNFEGRGVQFMAEGPYVQMKPNPTCDALLTSDAE